MINPDMRVWMTNDELRAWFGVGPPTVAGYRLFCLGALLRLRNPRAELIRLALARGWPSAPETLMAECRAFSTFTLYQCLPRTIERALKELTRRAPRC